MVPVVRTVLADLQTPVGAFMRLAGSKPYSFLLESVEGGERTARYSFLGFDPEMIVRGCGPLTFVERKGKRETLQTRAVDFVRKYFAGRVVAGALVWRPLPAAPPATSPTMPQVGSSRYWISRIRKLSPLKPCRSAFRPTRSGCSSVL